MASIEATPGDSAAQPKVFRANYVRSNQFRTVYCDGIFGGPTPKGMIRMGFLTETAPMPDFIEYSATPVGPTAVRPGEEIKRGATNAGIVREIEVDVVMTLETAKTFRKWLDEKIVLLENMRKTKLAVQAAAKAQALGQVISENEKGQP